jgi:FKBP-type peptidyl-prolyl cis-trans isomerase SlyD
MKVKNDNVVSFHYTLKNDQGDIIDSSADSTPLDYLHGHGNIIEGLESELAGKGVGDQFSVMLSPEKAYGGYDPSMVQKVAQSDLDGIDEIQVGMQLQIDTNDGPAVVFVSEIAGDQITLDGNHPLAGETLHFDVEVVEIREATQEELSHGHAHHPDGHH